MKDELDTCSDDGEEERFPDPFSENDEDADGASEVFEVGYQADEGMMDEPQDEWQREEQLDGQEGTEEELSDDAADEEQTRRRKGTSIRYEDNRPTNERSVETCAEAPDDTTKKNQRHVSHCQYMRYRLRRTSKCKVSYPYKKISYCIRCDGTDGMFQYAYHPVWSVPRVAQHYIMDNVIRLISQRFWHEQKNHTQLMRSKK